MVPLSALLLSILLREINGCCKFGSDAFLSSFNPATSLNSDSVSFVSVERCSSFSRKWRNSAISILFRGSRPALCVSRMVTGRGRRDMKGQDDRGDNFVGGASGLWDESGLSGMPDLIEEQRRVFEQIDQRLDAAVELGQESIMGNTDPQGPRKDDMGDSKELASQLPTKGVSGFRRRKGGKKGSYLPGDSGLSYGAPENWGFTNLKTDIIQDEELDKVVEEFLGPGATRLKNSDKQINKIESSGQLQRQFKKSVDLKGEASLIDSSSKVDKLSQGKRKSEMEGMAMLPDKMRARERVDRSPLSSLIVPMGSIRGTAVSSSESISGGNSDAKEAKREYIRADNEVQEAVAEALRQYGAPRVQAEAAAACVCGAGASVSPDWRGMLEALCRAARLSGAGMCEMASRCPRLLGLSADRVAGLVEVLRQELGVNLKSTRYIITRRPGYTVTRTQIDDL